MNTIDIAVIRAAIRRDRSFMESLNRPTLRASRARLYLALAEAVVNRKQWQKERVAHIRTCM